MTLFAYTRSVGSYVTEAEAPPVVAGPFAVAPIDPEGFLANDSYITDPVSASYSVLTSTVPDAYIEWFNGGAFSILPGIPPGSYSFTYQVSDYDGQGAVGGLATVAVTIQ